MIKLQLIYGFVILWRNFENFQCFKTILAKMFQKFEKQTKILKCAIEWS